MIGSWALRAFVVVGFVTLAFLTWRTIDWPIPPDASLMHYIAWLIGQGSVPYRDIFDINLPGIYLLHLLELTVVGTGDLGFRLWELAWLLATGAVLYRYCRPLADPWAAAAVSVLFALYHVAGGMRHAGEREFFLCIFLLLGALGTARYLEGPTRLWPLMWAGLGLGAAVMLKPPAALFSVLCAGLVALRDRQSGRSAWWAASILLGSTLVIPVAILGWLTAAGGLNAMFAIAVDYLPLFGRIGRNRPDRFFMSYWLAIGAAVVIGFFMRVPAAFVDRRRLAVLGVAYGVLHVLVQFKGSWYHFHPFALFLLALAAPALGPLDREPPRWPPLARALRLPLVVILVVVAAVQVVKRGTDLLRSGDSPAAVRAQRVRAVEADLRRLVPVGGTVQIMDVVEGGGAHALLRARIRLSTRFVNNDPFFHDENDPRILALRAEFITALEERRPAAVVIFPKRWRREGYGRLRRFPEFTALLSRDYTLVVDRNDYVVYVRRDLSSRSGRTPNTPR